MKLNFEDRQVVVTGGLGALGSSVVRALLDAGAHCHLPEFGKPPTKLPSRIAHSRLTVYPDVDLTDETCVLDFFARLPPLWASIHAVGGFTSAAIANTRLEDVKQQMSVNFWSTFLCCREAVGAIRRGSVGGRIVNVGSRAAIQHQAGMSAYATAKAAVHALTQSLAVELKHEGILVNAIVPSLFDTPANRAAMPEADHDSWPRCEQLAEAILFLASPANQVTHGALVPVYGQV